jgi:hypothetical protein
MWKSESVRAQAEERHQFPTFQRQLGSFTWDSQTPAVSLGEGSEKDTVSTNS